MLVDARATEIDTSLLSAHLIQQMRWNHEPTKSQGRGKYFACRSSINDSAWLKALKGADRGAIVTKLRVIVVLEDNGIVCANPIEQRCSSLSTQHGTRWKLVCGRDHKRVGLRR